MSLKNNKNNKSLNINSDNFFDINENTYNQSNSSDLLRYTRLFIILIVLAINIFILNWLIKVHKCKCANIDEALYLKEWYIFLIIINIISFIITLFNVNFTSLIILVISIILSIISFIMIIRILIYIHKLKKNNCDCGMTAQQNFIYYWCIVICSIILFYIFLGFLSFFIFINK
jgi:hypothetical protein